MKVFFHVQHLLGVGHLRRTAVLARALAEAGAQVTVASGGRPVPGFFPAAVNVLQLPAASVADASFRELLDEQGQPADEAWRRTRTRILLDAFASEKPDVLVVELFPFGRRQMRFELVPLLEAARAPLVACSVRDIIQEKPEREAEAIEAVGKYFDLVLVHGDPKMVPFGASFSRAADLGEKLRYTGYVVDARAPAPETRTGEVLVSAGGGAVGKRLFEAAMAARPLTQLRDAEWRVAAGMDPSEFLARLENCELSISQAGYNTAMETVQAGARAVLVPFAAQGETEQALRARLLAERGLAEVLEESALAPRALAAAVDRVSSKPKPGAHGIDLDGARRSAELLLR